MGVISAAVRELIAAGLSGDALVVAVERIEAELPVAKSPGAVRTEKWRNSRASQASQASQASHVTGSADPDKEVPPTPPLEINPYTPGPLKGASPPCEPAEIGLAFQAFNEAAEAGGWPQARNLTNSRRSGLKARLAEHGGIEGWRRGMRLALESDFLCGRVERTNGHSNWKPDLDFFLQAKSFNKLMEGSFANSTGPPARAGNAYASIAFDAFLERHQ